MADQTAPKVVLPFDVVEVDGEPDVGPSVLAVFGTEAQRRQARSLGIVPDEPDESGEQPPLP
jgi:hypothetical protein